MVIKLLVTLLLALFLLPEPGYSSEKKVVIYSSRKWQLLEPLLHEYSAKTGVRVVFVAGKAGEMLERLQEEEGNTQADLYYTTDAGYLWKAAQAGLLQPIDSAVLEANIPAEYRAPDNSWFGLSMRVRVIAYNTLSDAQEKLESYEELASENWKGRLVLCSSRTISSKSMVASLIAMHGRDKTEDIVSGWVGNQVVTPFSTDQTALEAIAAGIGDVTMVNSYYVARLLRTRPGLPLAVFWPNQDTSGVHVNISGAGLTRWSEQKTEAIKLLEWLSGHEAQALLANEVMEFPVNPQVAPHQSFNRWGPFFINPVSASQYGELHDEALEVMRAAKYR